MKKDIKTRAVRRLKVLEGQIRGLQKAVEEEKYCVDIIYQSQAVKSALSGVEDLILKNHLETHILHQIKHGKSARAIKEIMDVYKLTRKK